MLTNCPKGHVYSVKYQHCPYCPQLESAEARKSGINSLANCPEGHLYSAVYQHCPYCPQPESAEDSTPIAPLEKLISVIAPPRIDSSQPSPQESKIPRTIFISYRRQDSNDVTGRIYDRLVQYFGRETIFKDVDSIPLGIDFRESLGDAVGKCNLFLAVIGRQWLSSQSESGARRLDDPRDFVRIEIEAAMRRDIPVIPLLVQGAGMPGEKDLPPSLQALVFRNAIPIRPDPDFHHDIDRLIKGVELHFKNNS